MELSTIIGLVTVLVTFVLGIVSKKCSFIKNNLIPVQNLIIGIIAFGIYYLITKDLDLSLTGVGLFTGGVYDLVTNLQNLKFTDAINEETTNNEGDDEDEIKLD